MRRGKTLIASLIALAGFSALMVVGLKESGVRYMSVGELTAS